MNDHKRIVFAEDEALVKRGAGAVEMLLCSQCHKPQGVFVGVLAEIDNVKADNTTYKKIVIERWVCVNCRNAWSETYAIKHPDSGVEKDIFAAYNARMGGDNDDGS